MKNNSQETKPRLRALSGSRNNRQTQDKSPDTFLPRYKPKEYKYLNKKEILNYLKKHKVLVALPTIVKIRFKNSKRLKHFKATKVTYVVEWQYILKAFKMIK